MHETAKRDQPYGTYSVLAMIEITSTLDGERTIEAIVASTVLHILETPLESYLILAPSSRSIMSSK